MSIAGIGVISWIGNICVLGNKKARWLAGLVC